MACKKKIMLQGCMFSLQTKIATCIYLTKTPFQLNCKLHNILMPLDIKSDSCSHSGVRLFSVRQTNILKNIACLGFAAKENFFTLSSDQIFSSWCMPKKVNLRPYSLHTDFNLIAMKIFVGCRNDLSIMGLNPYEQVQFLYLYRQLILLPIFKGSWEVTLRTPCKLYTIL